MISSQMWLQQILERDTTYASPFQFLSLVLSDYNDLQMDIKYDNSTPDRISPCHRVNSYFILLNSIWTHPSHPKLVLKVLGYVIYMLERNLCNIVKHQSRKTYNFVPVTRELSAVTNCPPNCYFWILAESELHHGILSYICIFHNLCVVQTINHRQLWNMLKYRRSTLVDSEIC